MAGIFPGVPKQVWIVLFLVVNTGVNYIGISFTAIVNRIFLAAELLFIVIFLIMAIVAVSKGVGGADVHHQAAVRRGELHSGPRRHRLVHRGAELPRVRRHRDPQRGGQGRPACGRRRDDHRPHPRGHLLRRPDVAGGDAGPGKDSFGRRGGQQRLLRHRPEHQQPRLAGGVPRHERPGRRHRQRRGGPERHLPAAVLDEPRRTASPLPVPHQHQDPGAGAGHPARRRPDPAARAGLRRSDRARSPRWSTSAR